MLSPIGLRGRTPYRLEYSQGLFRKRDGSYKSPYGIIYSLPFDESNVPEIQNNYRDKPYKIGRVLSEYDFYTNYKKQPIVQMNLNMIF